MEEKHFEHDQIAKALLVLLMQAGCLWHEAVATAGLHVSRSMVYRLVQAVQTQGEAALQDKRQGHPAKLREAVLQWLVANCRAHPQISSREVQAALQGQFDIHVSIGHLNRVHSQLDIGNRVERLKKTAKALSSAGSPMARGRRCLTTCRCYT